MKGGRGGGGARDGQKLVIVVAANSPTRSPPATTATLLQINIGAYIHNYQYYFGIFWWFLIRIWFYGPQNPILIIKATILFRANGRGDLCQANLGSCAQDVDAAGGGPQRGLWKPVRASFDNGSFP